ncbi:MAG: Cna B-type domain-containing protein [Streptococcaceae bacterium]|jgi:LPXTG-motif cell wall-anchored protein|nr:Cna B-type domain-containing protein [Streptococcaceae bacterium]
MKKKILNILAVLFMLFGSMASSGIATALPAENLDASQFVTSVTLQDSNGHPLGSNKISDASTIRATYNLDIGDGSKIDTSQTYMMKVPKELAYFSTDPVELKLVSDGTVIGTVNIIFGEVAIHFNENVKSLTNVQATFFYSPRFIKEQLDYNNGNDLAFPTRDNPNNTIHLNFSRTSSGGDSSGNSSVSKMVRYDDDRTYANWTVVINNKGDAVADSQYTDIMENSQFYIPGSMTITYRNWENSPLKTVDGNPQVIQQADGTQQFSLSLGTLTSKDEKNDAATTSVLIHYQTKILYNSDNLAYRNTAKAYDGGTLIASDSTSAHYYGQGGDATGDQLIDVSGRKIWNDNNNVFGSRPASIGVELLQNGIYVKQMTVIADPDGSWNFEFTNVPEFDAAGKAYEYTVKEMDTPAGYSSSVTGTTITNTYTANELISLSGKKVWKDQNNVDGLRPSSINVHLLANNVVAQSMEVTSAENWQYSFSNLPKLDESGNAITYSVSEDPVAGYTSEADGMNLTNTHVPNKPAEDLIHVSGKKIWKDQNNAEGLRPASITVNLFADGNFLSSKVVGSQDKWLFSFTNLPKTNTDGKLINYTITENPVANYRSEISGTNITNTLISKPSVPPVKPGTPVKPNTPGAPETQLPPVTSPSTPNDSHLPATLPPTGDTTSSSLLLLGFLSLFLGAMSLIIVNKKSKQ